jgi:ribosome biogenesis GTPase
MKAQVVKSTGSWYEVLSENRKLYRVRLRGKFKLEDKKITNPIAVGDWVKIENVDGDFLIVEILSRDNYVIRSSPRKKGHFHLIASNIDQAIIVASLKHPKTSLGFIDRFLITLETFRIPGIILFNKTDLYNDDELFLLEAYKDLYQSIGYLVIITSLHEKGGSDLVPMITGKLSLVAGHSGTGKSTLINHLFPTENQAIGKVSKFADKGVHTTTFGEMFTSDDYQVIDTPGIKELGLAEVSENELGHYFPEIRELLGSCKFHDCSHINEPGCVVLAAVEAGHISESRYSTYLSIIEGDDNRR